MARVTFTQNCKSHAAGPHKPAPYYAVPSADTPVGARVRSKDGTIIPHILPPEVLNSPARANAATHAVYTFNGRKVARELGGRVYTIPDGEAQFLRKTYPNLIEILPSEELHADTVGALVDEKQRAVETAKVAEAKRAEAAKVLDETQVELQQSRTELANAKKEMERLAAEVKRLKAGGSAKQDDKKPAAKKPESSKK